MNTRTVYRTITETLMIVLYVILMTRTQLAQVVHETLGLLTGALALLFLLFNLPAVAQLRRKTADGSLTADESVTYTSELMLPAALIFSALSGLAISQELLSLPTSAVVFAIHCVSTWTTMIALLFRLYCFFVWLLGRLKQK